MAGPTYSTDLLPIVDFDGTPVSPTVAEPSSGWIAGRSPSITTDYPIQGSNHCDLVMNATGKAGALCSNGASRAWTTGHYLFGWIVWTAPGAIAEQAAGGLAMLCGSGVGDYKIFYVGGKSFGLYPYGGWQNFAVDPTMTGSEADVGTPTQYNIVGGGANVLTAVSKGSPLGFDAFRYGRGELRIVAGESGNYATFTGMATANDALAARWGLFQLTSGTYKWKGLMILGYGGLVNFTDANKNIVVEHNIFVNADFNTIEIRNASSVINWDTITITALGTVSKGKWITTDNATVNLTNCTFNNMDIFGFASGMTATGSTWRSCGLVTQNSATFTNCLFDKPIGTGILSNDPGLISGCTFISKGTGYAIEINTPGTYDFNDNNFVGFASTGFPGTSGNECIYNNSGGEVILNVQSAGSGAITYRNADGSCTTSVVSTVPLEVNGVKTGNEPTNYVRCRIEKASDGTTLMNEEAQTSYGVDGFYKATEAYNYAGDVAVIVRARYAGYLPFETTGIVTEDGLKVTAVWLPDPNYM